MSLNLSLLSSSLNSPLEQLPKLLWFQDVHIDKIFHTQRLKKTPQTNKSHHGRSSWGQLVMIPPWLLLKNHYLQEPHPRRFSWGKVMGGSLPKEVSSVKTSCHPDDPGAEIALWWLMRPSVAVNSAICNHFSYRPFGNHFGKFLFEQRRFWEEEKQSYFSCCREGFRQT